MAFYESIIAYPNEDEPEELHFLRGEDTTPLSDEHFQFKAEIDRALLTLNSVFPQSGKLTKDKWRILFLKILSAARNGLEGDNPQLNIGIQELGGFRELLVHEARDMRSHFISRTLLVAVLSSVVGFGAPFLLDWVSDIPLYFGDSDGYSLFLSLLFCLPGIGIANLFYAWVRHRNIEYENLRFIDEYKFSPIERFGYILVISTVLGIFLYYDVVTVGVAGKVLNDFKSIPDYGLLIGLICGLSEPVVVNIIRGASIPMIQPRRQPHGQSPTTGSH